MPDAPLEEAPMNDSHKLTSWIDWYRFAHRTLGLYHAEAASYANARYVEEQNRQHPRNRDVT
jgi:hypothetical protein